MSGNRAPRLLFLVPCVVAVALMYSSVAIFPYLRSDDTFLIRSNFFSQVSIALHGTSLRFWHIVFAKLLDQGRFLFWLSVNGTAYLYDMYGLKPLMYVRGAGVGLLGVLAYLLAWHLVESEYSAVAAFCLSVLILALPGVQVMIGNGVWLVPGALFAMWAALLVPRAAAAWHGRKSIWRAVTVVLLLIASLSVYQSLAFVFVAVAAAPVASRAWDERRDDVRRQVVWSLALMAAAVVIYFIGWLLLDRYFVASIYSTIPSGYAPRKVLHELPANVRLFFDRRAPQILNLWAAPYLSRSFAAVVAAILAVLWMIDVINPSGRRSAATRLVLYAALFGMSESVTIVADRYADFASKYTTSIAQSIVLLFVLVDATRRARAWIGRVAPPSHAVYTIGLAAVTLMCALKAQRQTFVYFVAVPSIETKYMATRISDFWNSHHRIDEIEVIGRLTPVLAEARLADDTPDVKLWHPEQFGEFVGGNFQSMGYMSFLARDVALSIMGFEPTRVVTRMGDQRTEYLYPGRLQAPDASQFRLVIDSNELQLSWKP